MFLTDTYANTPGLTAARETYERDFRWGHAAQGVFFNGLIDGATRDSGNTPTFEIRPGLLLGQVTATGKFKEYSPTATDGSEIATGVLLEGLRMQDFDQVDQDKLYAVLVGGPVRASQINGLDLMARQQMASHFIFDDIGHLTGSHWFPFRRFQNKQEAYTVVAADNFSMFDNADASGAVTFTLPAIARGYLFGFRVVADQNVTVASAEGDNMIALDDAAADSVAFSTTNELIGGVIWVYTNPAADVWIVENHSAGAHTITVAT